MEPMAIPAIAPVLRTEPWFADADGLDACGRALVVVVGGGDAVVGHSRDLVDVDADDVAEGGELGELDRLDNELVEVEVVELRGAGSLMT